MLWIEEGKITKSNLISIQKMADQIFVSSDIGRIPKKIDSGDGFADLTADEWKSFILIYSTPCMSLHLSQCCIDFGPLYSFWCFSFERMNGILGKNN